MAKRTPTEQEVLQYFEKYSNWGRWGKDDQLGTLNLITPAKRVQAAGLVREGVTVSCSRVLTTQITEDLIPPLHPQPLHFMIQSGEQFAEVPNRPGVLQTALDFFGLAFHNPTITHLDSVGHVFWNGKMYNGFSSATTTTTQGATVESVDLAKDGIVSRGVLLDIPRLRGAKWTEPDEDIHGDELAAAEEAQGIRVEAGDILLVRTGFLRRRNEEGPWDLTKERRAGGLHADTIPFLHERGVAALGRDGSDARGGYELVFNAIHQVGIVALGLWLIDYCNLEELASACDERQRWEFMLTLSPLRIEGGTGSPVNPTAIF
jgi:kynurenine formamidase